jgi:hypothetical protein
VVKFTGQKKDELLGVAFNRIMRMDINTGDHLKTWRYNTMKVCPDYTNTRLFLPLAKSTDMLA